LYIQCTLHIYSLNVKQMYMYIYILLTACMLRPYIISSFFLIRPHRCGSNVVFFYIFFFIKLEYFIFSIKKSCYTDTRFNNITKAYFNHEIITGNFVVSTWCIDDMFSGDRTKFGDFSGHLLFVKFYSFVHFQ
jgi:hypothetical protein